MKQVSIKSLLTENELPYMKNRYFAASVERGDFGSVDLFLKTVQACGERGYNFKVTVNWVQILDSNGTVVCSIETPHREMAAYPYLRVHFPTEKYLRTIPTSEVSWKDGVTSREYFLTDEHLVNLVVDAVGEVSARLSK